MAGSIQGGKSAAATNKRLYGETFYADIGSLGGSKRGIAKGFALMTPELRSKYGKIGGTKSRRRKMA
jgi:hypothetical protein